MIVINHHFDLSSIRFIECKEILIELSILLFESLGVLLSYPASHPNHTSYRKFYFNEFVANALRDSMGIIIFDLQDCGDC